MKILYVTGSCLQKNTSANMSHNSYIQGLIENGCDIDVIMAKDSFGQFDKSFPKFKEVEYYEYNSTPAINYVRDAVKTVLKKKKPSFTKSENVDGKNTIDTSNGSKENTSLFMVLKKIYKHLFLSDTLYSLDRKWLKSASHFKSKKYYDYIISNSSPASSHALVEKIQSKLSYGKWIQIWEDPWYFDIYGEKDKKIYEEEKRLISLSDYVFYVSPLTLEYQKKYFTEFANKMDVIPLPFLKIQEEKKPNNISFGYFGDYYSKTRNLIPFYKALIKTNSEGFIYGDSDENLSSTENVKVNGRVTLDELVKIQNKTLIYISLCNLKGGQIPGKIYHYSATDKPIIFILDGTDEEIKIIYQYFNKYNRYYFCKNNVDDISKLIYKIKNNELTLNKKPVEDFSPNKVIELLFKKVGELDG